MYRVRDGDFLRKNNHRQQHGSDYTGDDSGVCWSSTSNLLAPRRQSECIAASVHWKVCNARLETPESTNSSSYVTAFPAFLDPEWQKTVLLGKEELQNLLQRCFNVTGTGAAAYTLVVSPLPNSP